MKLRTSLILLVVGLAVLAAGWFLGVGGRPRETKVAPGTLVFPGLAAQLPRAASIAITNQGRTLTITRTGDRWGIADRAGYPVLADKLRELLTGLTELRLTEPRTADPAQYARLGVEDPIGPTATSNLLRVLDQDGKPLAELIVGHRRVRTQASVPESIYVRRPGETQSWLAEGRLPVDADPQLWFDRDIADIKLDRVATVAVDRAGAPPLTLAKIDGKPALTAPAEHPKLDDYRLEDVMRGLEQLTLTDVQPVAKQPGEALGTATYTLTDGTTIAVAVTRADKDIWAHFTVAGTTDEAKTLQARLGSWAYQLGSWKEKSFLPTLDDLKASEPTPAAAPPAGLQLPGMTPRP